jgi:hypothetical protein
MTNGVISQGPQRTQKTTKTSEKTETADRANQANGKQMSELLISGSGFVVSSKLATGAGKLKTAV